MMIRDQILLFRSRIFRKVFCISSIDLFPGYSLSSSAPAYAPQINCIIGESNKNGVEWMLGSNEALFWRRAASLSKLFDYVNLSVRELKTNYIYIACVLSLGLNLHFCDGTASHDRAVICRAHNGGFVLPARVLCVLCSRRYPGHLSGSAPRASFCIYRQTYVGLVLTPSRIMTKQELRLN